MIAIVLLTFWALLFVAMAIVPLLPKVDARKQPQTAAEPVGKVVTLTANRPTQAA